MRTQKIKWERIWESQPYKAEIYDNCSQRIYTSGSRIKIEVDGTRWSGNTGGFHISTYFISTSCPEGQEILRAIAAYDADRASDCDITDAIMEIMREG